MVFRVVAALWISWPGVQTNTRTCVPVGRNAWMGEPGYPKRFRLLFMRRTFWLVAVHWGGQFLPIRLALPYCISDSRFSCGTHRPTTRIPASSPLSFRAIALNFRRFLLFKFYPRIPAINSPLSSLGRT